MRSQGAEIDQLRAELERAKKENIKVKEISANAQDQLIALKSESSQRILEYEEEIFHSDGEREEVEIKSSEAEIRCVQTDF